MKKISIFIFLFIFSLASAQSQEAERMTKPIVSLHQIFQGVETKKMDVEISKAINSDYVVLQSNNLMELQHYLSFNMEFFGKKIARPEANVKDASVVFLKYNYSNNTLEMEIQNLSNGKKLNSKTISFNY